MDTLLNRGTGQGADVTERPRREVNALDIGRTACVLIGGVVAIEGLRRRSALGWLTALTGVELVREGITGQGAVLRALGLSETEELPEVVELTRTLTILRSPAELYALWRNPATLPRLLEPAADVKAIGETEAEWRLNGPMGLRMAWQTRITEDRPDEFIAWMAEPGAWIPHAASVRFRPAARDRGTEVSLRLQLMPPGGDLGTRAAMRFKKLPALLLQKTLRRFKSLAETGEIPTHRRAPACRNDGRDR